MKDVVGAKFNISRSIEKKEFIAMLTQEENDLLTRMNVAEEKVRDDKAALSIAKLMQNRNAARRAYIRRRVQELLGCKDGSL